MSALGVGLSSGCGGKRSVRGSQGYRARVVKASEWRQGEKANDILARRKKENLRTLGGG